MRANNSAAVWHNNIEDMQPEAAYGGLLNELRLDIAARGENAALARSLVAALIAASPEPAWDITVSQLEEIKVAVSEAVSNAIIHGYQEQPERLVTMRVRLHRRALVIEVRDDGVGITDIAKAMEPDFSTGEEHLGLGFAFMQSFMDEVRVASTPGVGTAVTLVKHLPPAAAR